MNEQAQQVSAAASFFEAFIVDHPVVTCIFLAWVVSWVVTVTFRPVLRGIFPETAERHAVRIFDVILAGLVVFDMWPNEYRLWWALGIGGASPLAYLLFSELLVWKWPALRKHLSLREFAADSNSDEPPKDQTP